MPLRAVIALVLLLLPLPSPAQRPLQVVATFPDLCAVAREVGGERAAARVLLSGVADPRFVVPQPDQALLLSRADLLLGLGGPLEAGWLPDLLKVARNPRLGEYLDVQRLLGEGAGPYPLSAPPAAMRLARALAEQLALLDPAGAAAYRERAAAFARDLERREHGWLLQLAPLRGHKVVTGDDSFAAFLSWAGLSSLGTLTPVPGAPGPPVHLLRLLRAMRAGGVRLVLQREYEPAQVARVLAERSGAQVVVVPLGARVERGERYADGMDQLVRAVAAALHHMPHGEAP